jgi:transposase InsO family protein
MIFTMKYTAHPERKTAFEQEVQQLGRLHGTIRKGSPWQNAMIERSNRTDNEERFRRQHFTSPEERRYHLRLWEMEYSTHRPHQGLAGKTPLKVFQEEYPLHATYRMLT